jgi:hypothetical protein
MAICQLRLVLAQLLGLSLDSPCFPLFSWNKKILMVRTENGSIGKGIYEIDLEKKMGSLRKS